MSIRLHIFLDSSSQSRLFKLHLSLGTDARLQIRKMRMCIHLNIALPFARYRHFENNHGVIKGFFSSFMATVLHQNLRIKSGVRPTMGHNWKLMKKGARSDLRLHCFSHRSINRWKRRNSFKNHLEKRRSTLEDGLLHGLINLVPKSYGCTTSELNWISSYTVEGWWIGAAVSGEYLVSSRAVPCRRCALCWLLLSPSWAIFGSWRHLAF